MHVSLAFVRNGTSYQKRIISHPFANRNVVYKLHLETINRSLRFFPVSI